MRCTVLMTRAIGLRSCMIGNGHVQFCSGRRWSNLPPDRNRLLLGGLFAQEGTPTIPAPASPTPPGPTAASAVSGGEVRGNRHSHLYHRPGCPGYMSMRPANIVPCATEAEAQQAGYRKAQHCP